MFGSSKHKAILATREKTFANLRERSDLLDETCGIGLWEAILHNGDAMDARSRWTWSAEFRRLIGYQTEAEYPNVVQSWSDRLHPDDVAPTFAAFGTHLQDKSGRARYDVTYRLKVRDGSYRWFRATGGCRYAADGTTVRACGSLTDIHHQKSFELAAQDEAEIDRIAIGALSDGLSALAMGDLTKRIHVAFSPKTQKLKDDFNAALERMQETIQSISANSSAISSGTNEISSAADDLSRRTEQQAASLEETAAALEEITATVRKTAEGSKHARDVVGQAKQAAEHSGVVVGKAIEAMGGIEKSATQISNIIGVIDEIAFQTNLLALNAGVEAARAGDAGRGFAVVASEVRALAQRSAEAAKEIKTLISASSVQVEQGVDLVGQTGKALDKILVQVAEINNVVGNIAASAHEQATALDEVNSAINQMDQVTQQNAAMVEESTAASHALSREIGELSQLIGRFQTGEEMSSAQRHIERKPVGPSKKTATRGLTTSMKTVGRGGAARKPEAASEWQEF